MFYSKSTGGFYDGTIHGDNIPSDAVEITAEQHQELLAAQSNGKVIVADDNGSPIAIEKAYTAEELQSKAKAAKIQALATLTVTTQSGKTFDGNETARNNMLSAIYASGVTGITGADWRMADNTIQNVTLDELQEALALAIQAVGEIVTA